MSFVCHYCLVLTFYSNNRISLIFAETISSHFSQHFTFDKNGVTILDRDSCYDNNLRYGNTLKIVI